MPLLELLALRDLPPGSPVLDLCCGTGRVTAALIDRGFRVAGLDNSREMLRYARENAPLAVFHLADARAFDLDASFDLVVSVFESLNHVMSVDGLKAVFNNVFRSLRSDGQFVFDLNREPAFQNFWNRTYVITKPAGVCISKTRYDDVNQVGHCELKVERSDGTTASFTILQKCHSVAEVQSALVSAGFARIELFDSADDLGMCGDVALARTFFRCTK
jgi:SAM-dependent methyltransferase